MRGVFSRVKGRTWIVGFALLAMVGALAAGSAAKDSSKPTKNQSAAAGTSYAKTLSLAFRQGAEKVLPSVVMIRTTTPVARQSREQGSLMGDDSDRFPFGDLFRENPELRRFFKDVPMPRGGETPNYHMTGIGSGVIIDPSGTILTNYHVVEGGGDITVQLNDGREFKGKDVKGDPRADLAILHIEGAGTLPAATLGDSESVEVGDWVLALGDPFGLEGTVTAGIISAKGRSGLGISGGGSFLQTDAAINPGNSGGPLVNLDGEVIGINTAISSNNGGNMGVGFAVPVNVAKWVIPQLEKNGAVQRGYLGVHIQQVTPKLAEQFDVKVHQGVVVADVQNGTPAAKAGVKSGDVIVSFDGKKVSSPQELQGLVERTKIGSSQTLSVLRDGKSMDLQVTVAELPKEAALAERGHLRGHNRRGMEKPSSFDKLGIQTEMLTPELAERLGIKATEGVVITDVTSGSPADLAGLSTGTVITEANRHPVKTVEDLQKALANRSADKGVLLLVTDGEGSHFVVIQGEEK
jgi:serine protease Do